MIYRMSQRTRDAAWLSWSAAADYIRQGTAAAARTSAAADVNAIIDRVVVERHLSADAGNRDGGVGCPPARQPKQTDRWLSRGDDGETSRRRGLPTVRQTVRPTVYSIHIWRNDAFSTIRPWRQYWWGWGRRDNRSPDEAYENSTFVRRDSWYRKNRLIARRGNVLTYAYTSICITLRVNHQHPFSPMILFKL